MERAPVAKRKTTPPADHTPNPQRPSLNLDQVDPAPLAAAARSVLENLEAYQRLLPAAGWELLPQLAGLWSQACLAALGAEGALARIGLDADRPPHPLRAGGGAPEAVLSLYEWLRERRRPCGGTISWDRPSPAGWRPRRGPPVKGWGQRFGADDDPAARSCFWRSPPHQTGDDDDLEQPLASLREIVARLQPATSSRPPASQCRLEVAGEDVLLDGERVRLEVTADRREVVLCYLRHLLDADGDWISGPEIDRAEDVRGAGSLAGRRWDRVYGGLPECLREIIELRPGAGYRLAPGAWNN
jgi:hypothetical protein